MRVAKGLTYDVLTVATGRKEEQAATEVLLTVSVGSFLRVAR